MNYFLLINKSSSLKNNLERFIFLNPQHSIFVPTQGKFFYLDSPGGGEKRRVTPGVLDRSATRAVASHHSRHLDPTTEIMFHLQDGRFK